MSVCHVASRTLIGHSRWSLITGQALIPATGQGTCYPWSRSSSTGDHKHFSKTGFSRTNHTSNVFKTADLRKAEHLLNDSMTSTLCNSHVSRRLHTPTRPGVLQPHSLLTSRLCARAGNSADRQFSITTKSILDSSPPSIQPYLRLIRFDKPIGTYLLFWPCSWSIAMAADVGQLPSLYYLSMFGAGAFLMRGAGCIINDMWDKDLDKKVERTKTRPLASGELTHFQALVFLGSQLSLALAVLLQFNTYSILLGAASMGLVVTYPLAKRFTYWPQMMLGVTLNWGVLLSWSALHGSLETSVLPLYLACVVYTVFYDTIYSHQDKYDDMLIGVKSTALKLGDLTKPCLAGFSTVMVGGLSLSGYMCDQTWPFYVGVGATAAHLAHQLYTVDLNNPDDCASKFRSNTQIGLFMFLAIVCGTLLKTSPPSDDAATQQTDVECP